MTTLTRDDLLRLTPAEYLRDGFRGPDGAPYRPLRGLWATAAANQLIAAGVPPQELAAYFEAIRQTIDLYAEPLPGRLYASMKEAGQIVSNMYNKDINAGLVYWALECARRVRDADDYAAFMNHGKSVIRNHATMVAFMR